MSTYLAGCECGWRTYNDDKRAASTELREHQTTCSFWATASPSPCTCPELMLNSGKGATGVRNWSEACPEHGVDSDWYRSPGQVAKRAADRERLIGLQEQARQARAAAREART
jgi:hypothetical protein